MTHRVRRAHATTIFLILLVCYGYFMPRWGDWNANSRADLVYALGDQGVVTIDAYHENTGDKACFPGPYDLENDVCNGHYYTDKSLGPSLMALPFYMIFKGVATLPPLRHMIDTGSIPGNFNQTLNPDGRGTIQQSVYQGMALTFITFFAVSIPSALLGAVVYLFAARFTQRPIHAFVLALAFGLATIAFPYSAALVQHQLSAVGTFIGFYLLWRVIYENARDAWLWVVGVLFGLVAITEYPAVVIAGIVFLWAVWVWPRRIALYRVVLGALPLGVVFAAYNLAAFGSFLPVGYEYSTLWQDVHQTGFLSLTFPTLTRLYGLSFSPAKGLFLLSPFLLLMIPGLIAMWRVQPRFRSMVIAMGAIIASYFTIYASSVMWWGGFTVGPRYLVPALPFMALPIIFAFDYLLNRMWGVIVTSLVLAWSVAHVWILTIAGQGWIPSDTLLLTLDSMNASFPLVDYSLPLLQEGDVARNYGGILLNLNGLLGLLPLLLVILIGVGVPYLLLHSPDRESVQRPDTKSKQMS